MSKGTYTKINRVSKRGRTNARKEISAGVKKKEKKKKKLARGRPPVPAEICPKRKQVEGEDSRDFTPRP
ncbi:hypothetical protein K0M31_017368 [Melipona bicolor]|uniref:Uncharacterized protein n=1 Tax=Melipona bicolor TaxID=60889 RepID=A0AA40G4R3_9HYME|nr:hypothetical protein K0M31_017368 [Melipona bicolor]